MTNSWFQTTDDGINDDNDTDADHHDDDDDDDSESRAMDIWRSIPIWKQVK